MLAVCYMLHKLSHRHCKALVMFWCSSLHDIRRLCVWFVLCGREGVCQYVIAPLFMFFSQSSGETCNSSKINITKIKRFIYHTVVQKSSQFLIKKELQAFLAEVIDHKLYYRSVCGYVWPVNMLFLWFACLPVHYLLVCLSGLWGAWGGDEAFWGPGVSAAGAGEQAGRGEGNAHAATPAGYCRLPAQHSHPQGNCGKKLYTVHYHSVIFWLKIHGISMYCICCLF